MVAQDCAVPLGIRTRLSAMSQQGWSHGNAGFRIHPHALNLFSMSMAAM